MMEGGGKVIKGRKTEEYKGRDGDEEDGIIGSNDEMRRKKLEGPPLQEKEEGVSKIRKLMREGECREG